MKITVIIIDYSPSFSSPSGEYFRGLFPKIYKGRKNKVGGECMGNNKQLKL